MTRASTMLLALMVLNVLLAVLCLVVGRGEHRSRALRLWGWGVLLYSAGILITIPEALPFHFRKMAGNALIAYSPIPIVAGVLAHTRWTLKRRYTTVAFLLSMAPIVWNHLVGPYRVLVDLLSPAPLANVLFLIAAVALVRSPPPDARGAARFLAGIFVFSVAVWSLRMLALWTSVGGTNDRERADLTIALFVVAQLVVAVACTLGLLWIEVRNMEAALRRLADTDALTGLPNRRATVAHFSAETARARRHRRGFALLLLDIDRFKQINDTHGHQAGDVVLRHVAEVLRAEKRDVDLVGRIGGEEFVVLLGEEGLETAFVAATRLRERIAGAAVRHGALELRVTASGGLAVFPDDGADWDRLFAVADERLYLAKSGGRNRVVAQSASSVAGAPAGFAIETPRPAMP